MRRYKGTKDASEGNNPMKQSRVICVVWDEGAGPVSGEGACWYARGDACAGSSEVTCNWHATSTTITMPAVNGVIICQALLAKAGSIEHPLSERRLE